VPFTCRASIPGVRVRGQGLPIIGVPLDRRTWEFDLRDGPLLLRFAPQRKGDGAPAEHLVLPFCRKDVLELDITEKCLRFGDELADHLTTVPAPFDDGLLGSLIVLLRSGNGKWHLAFFLLPTSVRDGSCLLDRSCRLIGQRRLQFISGAACHRTSSKEQGRQYEQNQRSRVSGSSVHATDSTHDRARRTRTRIKKFDVVEENPLAIGSDIHCCSHVDT
jgi:hypothetical protein